MAKRKRNWKRWAIAFVSFVLILAALAGLLIWRTHATYTKATYRDVNLVPVESSPRVAIVFGAGLWRNGQPSPVLYDRVATAAALYHAGRVDRLLMSGDNRFVNYNEPAVMRQTALEMGVPEEAIVSDYAGRRTYDSCKRAREVFNVQRAVLVTQGFHVDRALYLCTSMGIDSIGVVADRRTYESGSQRWWSVRESLAIIGAWIDLNVRRPSTVPGEKIPIQ